MFFFLHRSEKKEVSYYKTIPVLMKDRSFNVLVSDTDSKVVKGLSGRKSLGQDEAMLFVFQSPGIYKFWMKDMNFPLDIIWLDKDRKVIHIEHNLSPSTYPKVFGPDLPALFVLEVNSGIANNLSLSVGDEIFFNI